MSAWLRFRTCFTAHKTQIVLTSSTSPRALLSLHCAGLYWTRRSCRPRQSATTSSSSSFSSLSAAMLPGEPNLSPRIGRDLYDRVRRTIPARRTTITAKEGRSALSAAQLSRTSRTMSSSMPSGSDGRSPPSFFCVIAVICAQVEIVSPSSSFIISEYGARSVRSSQITMEKEKTSAGVP